MGTAEDFIKQLGEDVTSHPAVNHSFLETVSTRKFSKEAWMAFAVQLYPHVHFFIPYMEELLLNTFDMKAKLVVAKILLDEYGEDAEGDSHPDMFRSFAKACNPNSDDLLMDSPLDPATVNMVEEHMRLCRDENVLVGTGAIGQAHEYAIAYLFPPIVKGQKLTGFTKEESRFFSLHVEHDVEHSEMLVEAMKHLASSEKDWEDIRRGTLASLDARAKLWTAMENRMLAIDKGEAPPPCDSRTLRDMTKDYRNVPDVFWPQ